MEIQEIEISVRPDGTVQLHVRGAKGPQCLKLTEDIERLLGGQVLAREHTPEFAEAQPQTAAENTQLKAGW
jgi:hypothetical protein